MADDAADLSRLYDRDAIDVPGLPSREHPPAAAAPGDLQTQYDRDAITAPRGADGAFTTPREADGGFLTRTWHSLRDMVANIPNDITGADRTEFPDMPEFVPAHYTKSIGEGLRFAGALASGASADQLGDLAKQVIPGASVSTDRYGNPIITTPDGKQFYANKPGLSAADVPSAVVQTAGAVLGGGAANAAGRALGFAGRGLVPLVLRAGAQAAGQAAGSAAADVPGALADTGQGVDPVKALYAAAGGAAAEPAAALVGKALGGAWSSLFGGRGALFKDLGDLAADAAVTPDMLTRTGAAVLKKAGVDDPATLTVGQMRTIQSTIGRAAPEVKAQPPLPPLADVRSGTGPSTAERVVGSARTGIPMTVGQLTGDPLQIGREDVLRNVSGAPQMTMRGFGGEQDTAIHDAMTSLIPGVGTGPLPSEDAIGADLIKHLTDRKAALQDATNAAYDRVPNLTGVGMAVDGPAAWLNSGTSANILGKLQDIARQHAIYEGTPAARAAQTAISKLTTVPAEDMAPGVEGVAAINGPASPVRFHAMARPFNIGELDTTRRQLGSLYNSATNDADRAAVGAMRSALDNGVEAGVANGAMSGDPDVLANWKNAVATAKQGFEFFRPNSPVVRQFMDKITSGDLAGQEAVNLLYGAGQVTANKQGVAQMLDHLQATASPEAWETVRQAAARRMLFGGKERAAETTPGAIATRINEAVTGDGEPISKRLFSQPELDQLGDLRDQLRLVNQRGRQNVSGTAYTQQLLRKAGTYVPILGRAFNSEARAAIQGQMDAGRAVGGQLTPRLMRPTDAPLRAFPSRVAPVAAGLLGEDYGRQ